MTHPHQLRLGLSASRWLPVRDAPASGDTSPAAGWRRFDLATKAVLQTLVDRVDLRAVKGGTAGWAVPAPTDSDERHFLTLRQLGQMVDRSARHVRRLLKRLEGLGLVEREYRDWGASRIHLVVTRLQELVDWNRELVQAVETARRRTWRGEHSDADTDANTATISPAPPDAPPVPPEALLNAQSRRARRAAEVRQGQLAPLMERPQVAQLDGVMNRPGLVPWALAQADATLGQGLPRWAQALRGSTEDRQTLARLAVAHVFLLHGDAERSYAVTLAGVYARRLAVLWRGTGSPAAHELLELLAVVAWARAAGHLDVSGPGRVRIRPELRHLHRPSRWPEAVSQAREAWREAQARPADEGQPDTASALRAEVLELLRVLGLNRRLPGAQREELLERLEAIQAAAVVEEDRQLADWVGLELRALEAPEALGTKPAQGPAPPD